MDLKRSAKESAIIFIVSVCFGLVYNSIAPSGISILYQAIDIPDKDNISVDSAFRLYQNGRAVFIDARQPDDFAASHIPNSHNVPVSWPADKIANFMHEFNQDQVLIVYCSEPECNFSVHLAGMLKYLNYNNVLVFRGGMKEWSDNGYPVKSLK